jgi:hypothetical protein
MRVMVFLQAQLTCWVLVVVFALGSLPHSPSVTTLQHSVLPGRAVLVLLQLMDAAATAMTSTEMMSAGAVE